MKSKLFYWLPPIVWASLLFTLSSMTFDSSEPGFPYEDKLVHFGLFGMLSILLFFALAYERGLSVVKAALFALLITAAYGAFDEFHQLFTPGRMCDIHDWVADVTGGTLAFFACLRRSPAFKLLPSDEPI
jgi:VanZ family protein